jgi:hypothetical protein
LTWPDKGIYTTIFLSGPIKQANAASPRTLGNFMLRIIRATEHPLCFVDAKLGLHSIASRSHHLSHTKFETA